MPQVARWSQDGRTACHWARPFATRTATYISAPMRADRAALGAPRPWRWQSGVYGCASRRGTPVARALFGHLVDQEERRAAAPVLGKDQDALDRHATAACIANRSRAYCMMQAFHGMLFKPLDNPLLADLSLRWPSSGLRVDSRRIGVVGFCMGGGYALQMAITVDGLKAASASTAPTRVRSTPLPGPARLSAATPPRTSPLSMRAPWMRRSAGTM